MFKYDLIQSLLKDKRFKANRKGDFVQKLDTSEYNKEILSAFYSSWLMYMDAPQHVELRKKVQIPLNTLIKDVSTIAKDISIQLSQGLLERNDEIDVDKQIATPFVSRILSNMLGLNESDYMLILNESNKAVSFLWTPFPTKIEIIEAVDSINKTYKIINEIIDNQRYKQGKLIDMMLKDIGQRKEILALIINITVDGHEPFLSSVKSTIYYLLKYKDNPKDYSKSKFITNVLRLECPFPYCARNAIENIRVGDQLISKGDRVIFFISAGNRDMDYFGCEERKEPRTLTFGNGSHYCVGGVLTIKSLEELLAVFENTLKKNYLKIQKCNWDDTFGYRTITDLVLTKADH